MVAYPVSHPVLTAADVRELLRGRRSGASALTDAGGAFLLTDVADGVIHGVFAGRRGQLSFKDVGVTPGAPEADAVGITVEPLIGAAIRVRDSRGEPVRGFFEGFWDIGTFMSTDRAKAQSIPDFPSLGAHLAVADVSLNSARHESPLDMTYIAVLRTGLGKPIEASYAIRAPGYETLTKGKLLLEPLIDGIPVREVRLTPTGRGAGTVVVHFDGVGEALTRSTTGGTTAMLTLHQAGLLVLSRDVDDLNEDVRMTLDPGRYSLAVVSNKTSPPWPIGEPASIEIDVPSGGEPLHLRFDVSGAGTLVLQPWKRFGEPYDGKLTVVIGTPGQFERNVWVFKGFTSAPYRLVGLPADEFEVRTFWPTDSSLVQPPEHARARVPAGGEASLDLLME